MATIRDVARESGVSTATVSKVLNGRIENVSEETRDRVLATVRRLRYKLPASDERSGPVRPQTIAVVCGITGANPLVNNYYLAGILDGILEAAAVRGWAVTIMFEKAWDRNGSSVRRNYDGRCDGVILMAPTSDDDLISILYDRGTPFVSVGATMPELQVSSVDVDNEGAAREAVNYLWSEGHRKIAYLGTVRKTTSSVQRGQGYVDAMRQLGADPNHIREYYNDYNSQDEFDRAVHSALEFSATPTENWATEVVAKCFKDPSDFPTAIICWNDRLGIDAVRELANMGLSVPGDVSVVVFDDVFNPHPELPKLTCFAQPLSLIGQTAVDQLIKYIKEPDRPISNQKFPATLVIRESVAPPKKESRLSL